MCAAMTIGCYTTKAMAAGFNCTNKLTKVEKVICRSSRLSLLDDELNASYKLARNTSKHKGSLIAWQGNWIKYRNQCPDDICLYWSYLSALNHIRAYSDIYEDDFSCDVNGKLCHEQDARLLIEEYSVAFHYVERYAESWSAFANSHIRWRDIVKKRCHDDRCILDSLKSYVQVLWNTRIETPMPPSERGIYHLTEGNDPVCNDLLDNLNRFSYPMRCALEIHPSFSDRFRHLDYKRLDVQDPANEKLLIDLIAGDMSINWRISNTAAVEEATKQLKRLRILQRKRPNLGLRFDICSALLRDTGDGFNIVRIRDQFCQADNPTIFNDSEVVYLDADFKIFSEDSGRGYYPESGTIFNYEEKYFIFSPTEQDYVVRDIHKDSAGKITSKGDPLCYFAYKPFSSFHIKPK